MNYAMLSAVIEAPSRPSAAPAQPELQESQTGLTNGPSTSAQQQDQGSSQVSTAAVSGLQNTSSRYCCYFLHRLLDFRVPELRALADMCGVKQLEIEPIPEGKGAAARPVGTSLAMGAGHEPLRIDIQCELLTSNPAYAAAWQGLGGGS